MFYAITAIGMLALGLYLGALVNYHVVSAMPKLQRGREHEVLEYAETITNPKERRAFVHRWYNERMTPDDIVGLRTWIVAMRALEGKSGAPW